MDLKATTAQQAMMNQIMNHYANMAFLMPSFIMGKTSKHVSLSKPEPPVETMVGYVEGYRWWNAKRGPHGTVRLGSTGIEYLWEWGENRCGDAMWAGDGTQVSMYNSVGFHAFKKDSIEKLGNDFFGRVALYGDVCEHKLGYRAEKARILDLWCKPELWEQMQHVPKVCGTFTVEPETYTILDKDGEPFQTGDTSWLILTNRKELSDTNPSDSPTTRLRIKSQNPDQYQWMFRNPIMWERQPTAPKVMPDGRYQNSSLYAPEDKEQIVKPKGDYCPVCGNRILESEPLVVHHRLPDSGTVEIQQLVLAGTFKMQEERRHLTCEAMEQRWFMGLDMAAHDDHIEAMMYPTYGSISRKVPMTAVCKSRQTGMTNALFRHQWISVANV